MKTRFLFLTSLIFLLSFAGVCSAVYIQWDGGAGTSNWTDAANWNGDVIPGTIDKAGFKTATGAVVAAAVPTFMQMTLGGNGGLGILTVQPGAVINCTDTWAMGQSSGEGGVLAMSGGTITVGSWFYVGNAGAGTINMSGGSITVTGLFSIAYAATPPSASSGTVNLNGGTITAASTFSMASGGGGTAMLNITGGKLIVNGNVTSTIATYITNTWIKGYGSTSNVRYDYNVTTPGKTTVWAVNSVKATNPSPATGVTDVARNATLSWTGAAEASSHNVYFGTTSPGTFQINQTGTAFNPGQLEFNTTYYWRIDEVNGPNTVTGDVWSFTTVSGQAKNPDPTNSAANVAFDKILRWTAGPGAASHDVYFGTSLSDVNSTNRLLGDLNGNGVVDWNDISRLTEYWLLDPAGSEPYAGVDDDNIVDFFDYAMLAQDWMNSAGAAFKGNQDSNSFNPGALALSTTYYWRIDEVNGPDTIIGNIWSFSTQSGKAFNPSPANSASGVATNATLSWSAGAGATSHDVYFGTANPPTSIGNQAGTTYSPGTLANSTTYYWRIDEVSGSGTTTGDLWSFTTTGTVTANIRKGPYLIYPNNNTQMTVLWQVDVTAGCTIAWGTDTNYSTGNSATTEYSTGTDGHQHKYNITGLTPGVKYYYRVTAGSNNWTGNFYAAPAADATNVKFFMYGDTRTNGNSNNSLCGQMISTYTADPNYQTMLLHAGDWVNGDTEAYWTSEWYNYTWTSLMAAPANMPFMGAIGNHEGSATIFKKYRPFPFVAASYFSYDYGPVHVAVVDQYTTYTSGSTQYNWLVNDLSTSTKLWKIIVLHQPGWCAGGTHGNDATVQSTIQPLCVTYGVQIVLAGHNHYYSRAVVSGVQHVTSGSGGAPFYAATAGQPYVVTYTENTLECVKIAIAGNTLTGTTVSNSGAVIDTFTVAQPKATNPSPANSAANVAVTPTLNWTAGGDATSHNVYFGTANPPPSIGNQTAATYNPGTLANSTTYYWRIDEVSGSGTTTGDLWSFTTVPLNSTPVYPYLTWRNNPTNSVVVNWWNPNTTGDSTVDYGPTSSYGTSVNVATATKFHHVELTSLTAGATYHYRTRSSDGTISSDAAFTVPVASPTSFKFAVLGDTQINYDQHRAQCDHMVTKNPFFVLHTGDLVQYGDSQTDWENFFKAEQNLSKSRVFMPTMGNHEVQGTGGAYLFFDIYADGLAVPDNGMSAYGPRTYSFDYGNTHHIIISSYQINAATEKDWIAADLADANANPNIKWIFAYMHKPLYTAGQWPADKTVLALWGPVFDQYHVDIVFAGHNHIYERSYPIKNNVIVSSGNGTIYTTCGLGANPGGPWDSGSPDAPFFEKWYTPNKTGATYITINGNSLTAELITVDNAVLDTFTITK